MRQLFAIALCGGLLVHSVTTLADDKPAAATNPLDLAGNPAVKQHIEKFKGRGEVGDQSMQPNTPAQSLKLFEVGKGLTIECVGHEPEIRQPLSISFDERGRMWVVQYLQYPFPAGVKIVKYDEHLRAVFDKTPAPPGAPGHVPGADRITIHEDTDGDGTYDKIKTFAQGLNIATSCVRGRGGVWVSNPPYLLFYGDKDNDDVPDGPPVVHLTGFGMEDTHAVMNSLCWGPDGWLYGAQGSTCWATVSSAVTKDVHFKGQAIWRYHPDTKVFEVFAEGGGNTFCVEFDGKGRLYSGTNWGAVRGVHYVQGGRYVKGWGKHGPLMNPYSFGFFEHMAHEGYQPRFSHSFLIYEGGAMPQLDGRMVSIIPLQNRVQISDMLVRGSTFRTKDTETAVTTKERWFRPVDIKAGPDGAIYLADWYDTRLTHVDPRDTWDRSNGRIYRIRAAPPVPLSGRTEGAPAKSAAVDLSKLTSNQLIARLASANKWERQTAQRLLADRKDAATAPQLRDLIRKSDGQLALEALWALHASAAMTDHDTIAFLQHRDPFVRLWSARLAGDKGTVTRGVADYLEDLAGTDREMEVLSQLASTAKRLPGGAALPIIWKLAQRDDVTGDLHIPLLTWWALEDKAVSSRESVLAVFNTAHAWSKPMVRDALLPRLAQRYAADPTKENLTALAALLDKAPGPVETKALLASVQVGFKGQRITDVPDDLRAALAAATEKAGGGDAPDNLMLRLRAGDRNADTAAFNFVLNDDAAIKDKRIEMIDILAQVAPSGGAPVLLEVAGKSKWHSVRRAALAALASYHDAGLGDKIVAMYEVFPKDQDVRPRALDTLTKRREWAIAMMKAVESGTIARTDVPFELIERMKLHKDAALTAMVEKAWGRTRATAQQKLSQIEDVRKLLAEGDKEVNLAAGKALFTQTCGACHKLHGEGKAVGPDLTGYERDNLDFLLLAVIDPSAAVREEYVTYEVETKDGQVLTGFLVEQTPKSVTLDDGLGNRSVVLRADMARLQASKVSRMPEQLLDAMQPGQVKDFFAYLRSKAPVK